jgi:LacI family repressor for deo operon, udp, cdd, tsx, nupC, and nupG
VRVRQKEVAALARVSEATVSRVINGREGVSDRTRNTVLRALDELGAPRPSPPRVLRAGVVGIVVPEFDNPIFPAFAWRLETRFAVAGYTSVIGCATEVVDELEYLGTLVERGVAGVVMVSGRHAHSDGDHSAYRDLIAHGVAMVFINGYADDVIAPFVSCDDRHASALAVTHLRGLGHHRIGFIGGPSRYVVAQRKRAGFLDAMVASGIHPDPDLVVDTVYSIEGGRAAAATLVGGDATAVVAASDPLAVGSVLAARAGGLSVPAEWSVVGFDDTPLMAYTDPPLTTVRQPLEAMTEHAVRLLLDQLDGAPIARREYLFRPELVVRSSTARVRQPISAAPTRTG